MSTISANNKDFNISEISKAVGSIKTARRYRIYGLKNTENFPILIGYSNNLNPAKIQELNVFLYNNKIEHGVENIPAADNDKDFVYIGLRKDLRGNIKLCAGLVKTIILNLEESLKGLDKKLIVNKKKFVFRDKRQKKVTEEDFYNWPDYTHTPARKYKLGMPHGDRNEE